MIGAALLGAVLSFGPSGAATCIAAAPSGIDAIAPNRGDHNPRLMEAAILHFTNKARCAEGLRPVDPDPSLQRAAKLHTENMISEGILAHESGVRGAETLAKRLRRAGAAYRVAVENLITGYFMIYRSGASYQILDDVVCLFRDAATGEVLKRQSYASIGQDLVDRWLKSPGHRKNLLLPEATRHGAALGPTGQPALCGEFYATQVLAE